MKWLLGIVIITASAIYAQDEIPQTYTGPKENLHIYLLIGQSNMAGRARFTEEDSGVIERCYLLNDKDEWEPAKNPLNRYSTIKKRAYQGMNPGYMFSKKMLEQDKNISLGLVVNAKGGTSIEMWEKGTEFYEEAIRRVKEAQKTGVIKGIVWHQGEGNATNPEPYLGKLQLFVQNLRKDLGEPNLPFVAGQLFADPKQEPKKKKAYGITINEQLEKLPEVVPFTGCASSEGTTVFEGPHFDAEGMKLLGQRYAEEMRKVQQSLIEQQTQPSQ